MDISERNFEATIERTLLSGQPGAVQTLRETPQSAGSFEIGGYRKREPTDYDRALCLDAEMTLAFIYATQPAAWEKLKKQHGAEVKTRFLKRLKTEIDRRGTLDVLRNGVKDVGCRFQLAYFKPSSGLNEAHQRRYEANLFTVIRQLKYSETTDHSLDLALFLNGLPLFTAELKNPFTGQTVSDAIHQYKTDRDPREPLFAFGRCVAHFAVDPDLVFMTTHLDGENTDFRPFNQGWNGGAKNPPRIDNFSTAYLWEQSWAKDSVLNLTERFIHIVDVLDDRGRKTGKRVLIFPRYHQLDCVRRLLADARTTGAGEHYLIQHSAGSGKSNTIAWLAHQLTALYNADNQRIFDSILVVTDRRVLDRQLQRTVRQFEQTRGVVENIDKTSRQLKSALEDGKQIIVTTLQKFPVIVNQMGQLPGKRFALLIDEAHSSQSGESSVKLKQTLAPQSLESAETDEGETGDDLEDRIVAEIRARGRQPNVSTFAFTATPKNRTLELFGKRDPDGTYVPFSLYTMRQAIEEGYILDVLENYTTYRAYWRLLKTIEDDPRYDRQKAVALLKNFVELHEHAITKKVTLMVEHFAEKVAGQIGGKAKAMIVTRSRLHAVRYKLAVERYLTEKGCPYKVLVAFSGTVKDPDSLNEYTEAAMNGFSDKQTATTFDRDEYRILIVANKFQTGFDQPLLHTMYVDRKLSGVHAVQTLSRLNRTHPDKNGTMVLDFANDAETIGKAFEPYYDRTLLSEGTDPNLLYDLMTQLAAFHFYTEADVNRFAEIFFNPKGTPAQLHGVLSPVVEHDTAADDAEQYDFRGALKDYIRRYAFLSQVITFVDTDLEKLYVFAKLLLRKLPPLPNELPLEITQNVDMESYRLQKLSTASIELNRGEGELAPQGGADSGLQPAVELEPLSQLIDELNRRFGVNLTARDKLSIQELQQRLQADAALTESLRVNSESKARMTFDLVANDKLQDMFETNFKLYKLINDDTSFQTAFLDWMFERYCQSLEPAVVTG